MTLLAIAMATACYGCPYTSRGPPEPIQPPREPRPIAGLNSPHDDYNAAAPIQMANEELIFASNRGSKGFDLYWAKIRLERDAVLVADEATPYLTEAMSDRDELGPTIVRYGAPRLVFASDRAGGAGGLDLWWYPLSTEHAPRAFGGLNSAQDDAYWTWHDGSSEAYFASNRGGDWDIYAVSPPLPGDSAAPSIRHIDELASPRDDTAPFLFAQDGASYLLFASTRAGADFDLYCSRREGQRFTEPKPLRVNTRFEEFRPITLLGGAGMVFSSNRPGGAGGMDLWYGALENPCRP